MPATLAEDRLVGSREPRIRLRPPRVASRADEAIDLYALTGQALDPWQADLLDDALGVDESGLWVAFDVGWMISRQNGKGGGLEARMLAGLFLWNERLQVYTAHQFKTAQETFLRIRELITNTDVLRKRVRRITTGNGDEGVELLSGQRLRFLARSGGSGRGFTGVTVYLDEGMLIDLGVVGALVPTMSAMPNPQLFTAGSAGPVVGKPKELALEFARLRRRALMGEPGIAYGEWSAVLCDRFCRPGCVAHDRRDDPRTWAKTNPSLGIVRANGTGLRLTAIQREWAKYGGTAEFDLERLGVGDWPEEPDEEVDRLLAAWADCADESSVSSGRPVMAIDVSPGSRSAAIVAATPGPPGRPHVEVVEHRSWTDWVVGRAAELDAAHDPVCWVLDPSSPAGALLTGLAGVGVAVEPVTGREMGQACEAFTSALARGGVRHPGDPIMTAALAAAGRRDIGDGLWAWSRRRSGGDICPLVATTLALARLAAEGDYDLSESFY